MVMAGYGRSTHPSVVKLHICTTQSGQKGEGQESRGDPVGKAGGQEGKSGVRPIASLNLESKS
jgi:hypothetical protein